MEKDLKESFNNLESKDDMIRLKALQAILDITENKVDWIYEVWDDLFRKLDDENSYQRIVAIRLLCNLVKSDTENRIQGSLNRLLAHTTDEKFIASRICLQSIWKIAAAKNQTREIIIDHLEKQFEKCLQEKHYNLIRQDIILSMRQLYDQRKDNRLLTRAEELIKNEKDEKYRKKYVNILKVH
jgi:hypothetical protein